MNRSRHHLIGRLTGLLQRGRARLGNFHRGPAVHRRPPARGHRHVLDVVVKSSRMAKRERARRWRRTLKWLAVGTAAATMVTTSHQAVARYFWQNPDLLLAHSVEVRTNGTLTYDAVLRHAGLSEQMHVYAVDLTAARERLESLPNVRHAAVERELPGNLVIEVEERLPVFWLSSDQPKLHPYSANPDSGARLLDENGHVFLCTELRTEVLRLPVLHLRKLQHSQPGAHLTTPAVQTSLNLLRRLQETFGPRGLNVTEIEAPNDWSLVARLTNDLTITFAYEALDLQVDRLSQVIAVADERSLAVRTVNLLPRKNVPVTFASPSGPATPNAPTTLADAAAAPSPHSTAVPRGQSLPVSGKPAAESEADRVAAQIEAILGGGR